MITGLTLWIPVVLTALLLLAMLYRRIYHLGGRPAEQVLPSLSPLGSMGVHDLFSGIAESHLRMNLTPQQFRRAQRHRMVLALEYIRRISLNAVALQQWATHELVRARALRTPDCSRLSMKLMAATVHCRMCALVIQARLSCCLILITILPFVPPPSFDTLIKFGKLNLLDFYAVMRLAARELGAYFEDGQERKLAELL